MPPSPAAASAIADRHDASSVTSHVDRERRRSGFLRGGFEELASPREQGDVGAALREADPDATPEPARRTYDDGSHCCRPPRAVLSVSRRGRGGRTPRSPRR